MNVDSRSHSSIWYNPAEPGSVFIIDQRKLPFHYETVQLTSFADAYRAIKEMWVRGAPLIGVTAAFGLYLAASEKQKNREYLIQCAKKLKTARPTAVNLAYGIESVMKAIEGKPENMLLETTLQAALTIRQDEIERSKKIGEHGLNLFCELWEKSNHTRLNILTHCNAGWLACVEYGTATAPIYMAHDSGIPIHVYVDETRPRNQGARLTAWELQQHGVPHTVIPDNTGGLLMQKGMIDAVIVGSDRTSIRGDVVNKIGTYLKALAAKDNNLPFYVALPGSTIDRNMHDAAAEAEIEQRNANEIRRIEGLLDGKVLEVEMIPAETNVLNYGFDITPASMVSALITEKGICKAEETAIRRMLES